jgi:hypothetical protein
MITLSAYSKSDEDIGNLRLGNNEPASLQSRLEYIRGQNFNTDDELKSGVLNWLNSMIREQCLVTEII